MTKNPEKVAMEIFEEWVRNGQHQLQHGKPSLAIKIGYLEGSGFVFTMFAENLDFEAIYTFFKFPFLSKALCKEWRIKKWTGFRGHNSRSKAARAKRSSPAESL